MDTHGDRMGAHRIRFDQGYLFTRGQKVIEALRRYEAETACLSEIYKVPGAMRQHADMRYKDAVIRGNAQPRGQALGGSGLPHALPHTHSSTGASMDTSTPSHAAMTPRHHMATSSAMRPSANASGASNGLGFGNEMVSRSDVQRLMKERRTTSTTKASFIAEPMHAAAATADHSAGSSACASASHGSSGSGYLTPMNMGVGAAQNDDAMDQDQAEDKVHLGVDTPPQAQMSHGHTALTCATTIEAAFDNRFAMQSDYTTSMSIPATSPHHFPSVSEPTQSNTEVTMFNVPNAPVAQIFSHSQTIHMQKHMQQHAHAHAQTGASPGLAPVAPLLMQQQPAVTASANNNKFCTQCGTVVRTHVVFYATRGFASVTVIVFHSVGTGSRNCRLAHCVILGVAA